jgi:hypothetical protein
VRSLSRLVYWEEKVYAAYYAMLSDSVPESSTSTLISTGNWNRDALHSERCSFFIRLWANDESYQTSLVMDRLALLSANFLQKLSFGATLIFIRSAVGCIFR